MDGVKESLSDSCSHQMIPEMSKAIPDFLFLLILSYAILCRVALMGAHSRVGAYFSENNLTMRAYSRGLGQQGGLIELLWHSTYS